MLEEKNDEETFEEPLLEKRTTEELLRKLWWQLGQALIAFLQLTLDFNDFDQFLIFARVVVLLLARRNCRRSVLANFAVLAGLVGLATTRAVRTFTEKPRPPARRSRSGN